MKQDKIGTYLLFLFTCLGTVDIFEYLLGNALLQKQDPNFIISYLFKIFDKDKDGLLSQAEVVDVLNTFFILVARNRKDETDRTPEYNLEEIKNDVSKGFGDKTQISPNELIEVCEQSSIMRNFAMNLQTTTVLSMMVGECCIQ